MGCGCKKEIKRTKDPKTGEIIEKAEFSESLAARIILFIIVIALSPLMLLVMLAILFNYFFISGKMDLVKTGVTINKAFSKKSEEEFSDDDEYNDIYVVEELD